jgi:hypothetical protein
MTKNGKEKKDKNVNEEQPNDPQKKIGMLKRHVGNSKGVKLNMKIFFFQAIEDIKTLKIEGVGYNVGGH